MWTYPIVCQILLVLSEAEVDILLLCGIRVRPAVAGMVVLGREVENLADDSREQ